MQLHWTGSGNLALKMGVLYTAQSIGYLSYALLYRHIVASHCQDVSLSHGNSVLPS